MKVTLALTGFGNVGRGIAVLLRDLGDEYYRRYGLRLVLTGVADRGGAVVDPNGLDPASLLSAKEQSGTVAGAPGGAPGLEGAEFLEQANAQVLIEAASTNFVDAEPGWSYIRTALGRNMQLVLASKGALVLHWDQIMRLTSEHNVSIMFSGTVGAPLPVCELAERMLVGTQILGFEGLVNGTSNAVLAAMADGLSYDEGVRQAQDMGIAETDPTLDVDGWDAAAKVVIIANALLGAGLRLEDVEREGIRGVTVDEMTRARARGAQIKLVAGAQKTHSGVKGWVRPQERPLTDTLGALDADGMGIVFATDLLGQVAATVQHTGGNATALTCLRDVINLARDRGWTREQG